MSDLKNRLVNDISLENVPADAPLLFVPASVNQLPQSCNKTMRVCPVFQHV
jgi:hypothetical protein